MTEIDELQRNAYDQGYSDREKIADQETADKKMEFDLYMDSAKALIDDLKEQTFALRKDLETELLVSENLRMNCHVLEGGIGELRKELEEAKSQKIAFESEVEKYSKEISGIQEEFKGYFSEERAKSAKLVEALKSHNDRLVIMEEKTDGFYALSKEIDFGKEALAPFENDKTQQS